MAARSPGRLERSCWGAQATGVPSDDSLPLDALVASVLQSAKYREVSPDLVRDLGARELARGTRLKEAVKATKNKLHQVAGAYVDDRVDYDRALVDLQAAAASGAEALRDACIRAMRLHASTRERVELLDESHEFYATTLASVAPVRSVLDLACGLNPLAVPWMPLAQGATYHACDILGDLTRFLDASFASTGVRGRASMCDLLQGPPADEVHVAFLLKAIPCLEQVDKQIGLRLLDAIRAEHVLVSFPARTLGGRQKGMADVYEARFRAMVADRPWRVERFAFRTELAFLLSR
jgi:16S rRNA (guanine(1405)-N(7))-methyltransferase